MNLTVRQLEVLQSESTIFAEGTHLNVIEEGEWIHDYKSQSLELIFTDGEKYYRGFVGRSGSYHSGWDYDSDIYGDTSADITEVVKREVITTEWVNK